MRLNWKNIHLTNENIHNGSLNWHRGIQSPRKGGSDTDDQGEEQSRSIPIAWDFSHLDNIIETLLREKPGHDVYLYGSVESAYDPSRPGADVADQAPILIAITLPSGRVPTRTVGRVNNQTSEDSLANFDDLNYDWVSAPSFGGRVHYLVCNADFSTKPDDEDEAQMHQHCSLFVITPRDLRTNAQGRYKVDHMTFNFLGEDGEEEVESWDRSEDPPLRDHLDQIADDYFENASVEDRAIARGRIMQAAQREIQSSRERKVQRLNLFFGDLSWNKDALNDLRVFKITPVNFTAAITKNMDRYFSEFFRQQPGGQVCYSDHASISGLALVRQVPKHVLARFNDGLEPSSPTTLLFMCLLVDFLHSTRYIDNFKDLSFDTPVIFDTVLKIFGIDRVVQYFGQDTTAPSYPFQNQSRTGAEFLRDVICPNVEQAFKRAGRTSSTQTDFLSNFIWQQPSSLNLKDLDFPVVYGIRLGQSNADQRLSQKIISPGSLEVRFDGSSFRGRYVPINVNQLRKHISDDSIPGFLLQLLCNPGVAADVPPGARDDDHVHPGPRDCLKAAILAAPDVLLSPVGKLRVESTFPPYEITISKARSLLSSKVKTVCLKQIKSDIDTHAMTSNEVMVGVFCDGPLQHCVLIDGSNGAGSITDPATRYKKGLVRSKRTLNKLGINKFRHLFVLKRVELSRSTRMRSTKSLGLPFFLPSVSENDSNPAP